MFGPGSEWFWALCQFVAVSVMGLLILRQLRLQSSVHLVSSFAILDERWKSRMMLQARCAFCKSYLDEGSVFDQGPQQVAFFLKDVGTFLRLRGLNREVVWETYSFYVEYYWLIMRDEIYKFRRDNAPTFFKSFEWLYWETLKMNRKKKAPVVEDLSPGEIRKSCLAFAKYELKAFCK